MPAAAVIPAPIAYTKIVAVKKLVVGFLARSDYCCSSAGGTSVFPVGGWQYLVTLPSFVGE